MREMIDSIKRMFFTMPPQLSEIEAFLRKNELSQEAFVDISVEIIDFVEFDYVDFIQENNRKPTDGEIHILYLYSLMELFLKHGMDPNAVVEGNNVMEQIALVRGGYIAADIMRLFMEHGGKADLMLEYETLFDMVDFDVYYMPIAFDEEELPDAFLYITHIWLVLLGYGGCFANGKVPIVMEDGYSIEILREHEKFEVGYKADENNHWSMSVYEKATDKIVARMGCGGVVY